MPSTITSTSGRVVVSGREPGKVFGPSANAGEETEVARINHRLTNGWRTRGMFNTRSQLIGLVEKNLGHFLHADGVANQQQHGEATPDDGEDSSHDDADPGVHGAFDDGVVSSFL